ncbi:MAG: DUF4129 domain-containing protein [Chloroflexota bacterium]
MPDLRLVAEAGYTGALALVEAVWVQAWLAGPAWPAGWLILGLTAVQLVTWATSVSVPAGPGARRLTLILGLSAALGFAAARSQSGSWAAVYGLAAAALMAYRGAATASDRADPAVAFRRVSVSFALTGLALHFYRVPQATAAAIVVGLLLASGTSLAAARWLEITGRHGTVGGLPVVRSAGQLVGLALLLVGAAVTVLTPSVLVAAVLRPLGWLAGKAGDLIALMMLPVARLLEAVILKLQAHASPQVIDLLERMLQGSPAEGEQLPTDYRAAETLGRYLSFVVLGAVTYIAYRMIAAALARRRAVPPAGDGTVTVTRLTAGATHVRPQAAGRAGAGIDGTPAGQVRFIYRRTLLDAAGFGIARRPSETPAAYAVRLSSAGAAPEDVLALTQAYEQVRYGGERPAASAVTAVRAAAERVVAALGAATRSGK